MTTSMNIYIAVAIPIIIAFATGICFYILGSIIAWIRGVQAHGNVEDLFSFNDETWFFWGIVVVLSGIVEMSIWSDKK